MSSNSLSLLFLTAVTSTLHKLRTTVSNEVPVETTSALWCNQVHLVNWGVCIEVLLFAKVHIKVITGLILPAVFLAFKTGV